MTKVICYPFARLFPVALNRGICFASIFDLRAE